MLPPLSSVSTSASVSGARISSQIEVRSRTPRRKASCMPSTSTVIGSTPTGAGSPTTGMGSLPRTSSQRSPWRSITVNAAPSVWASMAGRSAVRVRERTRCRPSHASHTEKPSAMAVPVIHRSCTSPPVHDHLGWINRCSMSRADSACWPPNGCCKRRP